MEDDDDSQDDEIRKIRAHELVWRGLYDKVDEALGALGTKGYRDDADYWIIDDDWGWDAVQVELPKLDLLRPDVVKMLQTLLVDYPDWEITVRVDVVDAAGQRKAMGLIIHSDEIVDELQREFLPETFRDVVFGTLAADIAEKIAARVRQLMNKPPTA